MAVLVVFGFLHARKVDETEELMDHASTTDHSELVTV